jgi:hypothetical protein
VAFPLNSERGQMWLEASEFTFYGQGQILPRLVVGFQLRKYAQEYRVKVLYPTAKLKLGNELLAFATPLLGPFEAG